MTMARFAQVRDELVNQGSVIRVAIVDDHELLSQALTMLIGQEPDLEIVGTTVSCAGAQELVTRTHPDVLLLDVSLPDGDGLALIPGLRRDCPQLQILVLTSMVDQPTLLRAVEAGVSGFVGKHRPVADVLEAVRRTACGEMVMPTELLLGLLARPQPRLAQPAPLPQPAPERLSTRELEVLACAADGQGTPQIAEQLSISVLTVRTHLRNIIGKLHAHSRLEAVAIALRHGLIAPPR
jgi:DNA-binding NarL/FixJ family response regulator